MLFLLAIGDDVYMEDEDELKEYIVRQSGAIYVGSYKTPTPKQWHFGQVRLTHHISYHWYLSISSENTKKPLISGLLRGY